MFCRVFLPDPIVSAIIAPEIRLFVACAFDTGLLAAPYLPFEGWPVLLSLLDWSPWAMTLLPFARLELWTRIVDYARFCCIIWSCMKTALPP